MARVDLEKQGRSARRSGKSRAVILASLLAIAGAAFAGASFGGQSGTDRQAIRSSPPPTALGINLFGLANYNRQQVYLNLINQSEWFSSHGQQWQPMPASQLDKQGWVRHLEPGQIAPRPLVLPPTPFGETAVRCTYRGRGEIGAGGIAHLVSHGDGSLMLKLLPVNAAEDGAWIELRQTDPGDPVRDIDCRETIYARTERFHPAFLEFVKGFKLVRFLDWQKTNDNARVDWTSRTTPASATQTGPAGAAIEDMADLANLTGADPWFLMPYQADEDYVRQFAQLVHARVHRDRTVYVELGNEVWNDMFDAAQQARREGMELKLGAGDPKRAQMIRYAQKVRQTMKIWTEIFADRPGKLVRVAASQHAWPDLARTILEDADTADWVDALATAPYIWLDLKGNTVSRLDSIFAAMPRAIDATMTFTDQNRVIALRHGKRFIGYEGGQHLVTPDLTLARAIQRDPRMAEVYRNYLSEWEKRSGDALMLYASSAPIADYGAWGLMEYAGQPISETPKLRAIRDFQARAR